MLNVFSNNRRSKNVRKVIFLIHVSLDGYAAGPNGEMDWILYNDELEQYAHALHDTTDTAIYGRNTYQMMDSYWPTVLDDPESTPGAREHARWYADATKIVVSKSLESVERENTVLLRDNISEEINRIKRQPGKDLWLLGSPSLAQTFMRLGLIDEYRINVNPVVLGAGQRLFEEADEPVNLNLLEAKTFDVGVVALRYVSAENA
jgi:dihydrofolate reductase